MKAMRMDAATAIRTAMTEAATTETYNNSQTIVRNAFAGGQAPARPMPARLHNTIVDLVATMAERRERAAVQRALNIVARRVARNKSIRVRVRGVVIRPEKAVR